MNALITLFSRHNLNAVVKRKSTFFKMKPVKLFCYLVACSRRRRGSRTDGQSNTRRRGFANGDMKYERTERKKRRNARKRREEKITDKRVQNEAEKRKKVEMH